MTKPLPTPTTTLIQYRGQVVAIAGPERFHFAPHVEALTPGDPVHNVVTLMCAFAHRVAEGALPGPYSDERAELYARCALIDDEDFACRIAAGATDPELAGHFKVPLEQIAAKRSEPSCEPPVGR